MFKKAILSATILAVSLGALQPAAQASDDSTVVRDHRAKTVVRDHRTEPVVRDHRTETVVRDHRTETVVRDHRQPAKNEVVPVNRPKLACHVGYRKLQWNGYSAIQYSDCGGVSYSYRAIRNDMLYRADMNAYSGEIQLTMLGFAH
jgi:hypothetical protein